MRTEKKPQMDFGRASLNSTLAWVLTPDLQISVTRQRFDSTGTQWSLENAG